MVSVTTVEAGRQLGDVNAHPATPCFAARLTERTNRSTSAESFFITVMCSDLVIEAVEPGRQLRPHAAGGFHRIGELGRMRGRQHDVGDLQNPRCRDRPPPAPPRYGDRRDRRPRARRRGSRPPVSVSSARPASNSSRIAASVASGSTKRPDCFSEAISRRTLSASRRLASNSSRSKFEETWMSIEGEAEA